MADWISAIVPAGGRGVRMGSNVPKQFLTLGDVPLLVHALQHLSPVPSFLKLFWSFQKTIVPIAVIKLYLSMVSRKYPRL